MSDINLYPFFSPFFKVKAANAPDETAKFLGHGLCDSHSKGSTLTSSTNESSVIKRESLILMKMLNVDPKNLRGLGIQVAKLDKPNEPTKGQNKSILNFLTTKSPVKPPVLNDSQEPGPSNAFTSNPSIEVCINFYYRSIFLKAGFNLNTFLIYVSGLYCVGVQKST